MRRLAVVAARGGSPTAPALAVNSPDQPGGDAAPAGQAGVANPTARQVLWEAYGEQSTRWFYDLMPLICKNPKRQAESLRCGWAGLDAPLGFQGAPL